MSEEIQQQPPSTNQTSSETPENGLSQAEILELLQKTVSQLGSIVAKLNAESLENLPSKTAVEMLVSTTEALAASLGTITTEETEVIGITQTTPSVVETNNLTPESSTAIDSFEEAKEIVPSQLSWFDRILPSFSNLQTWWDGLLGKIRSLLPEFLQQKLSDWTLTGILAGTIVTILLTSVLLFPQPSTEVTEVVESPPEEVVNPPESVETPPELKAPGKPKRVKIAPPPKPELTPEQSLVAAIQEQVAEITSQYSEGLILSIEASFLDSRLKVTLGKDWYKLNDSRQDKLANEILKRSKKLDFRKLEILDTEGTLLARNPVVGNNMVILQRS